MLGARIRSRGSFFFFFFLKTKTDYIDKFWMYDHTYNHNQDYKENFECMIKTIITKLIMSLKLSTKKVLSNLANSNDRSCTFCNSP